MTRVIILSILVPAAAAARPGFYIGLGVGPTSLSGEQVPNSRFSSFGLQGAVLDTEQPGGVSGSLRLGFNILGYGALEVLSSAHGQDLFNAGHSRSWAAHAHVLARAYPLWHWQRALPGALQPLEPSLFFGWGTSAQGYVLGIDEIGWSGIGTYRMGFGLEYFLVSYFKVALEYHFLPARYDTFVFNLEDSETFAVQPPARADFHQAMLSLVFQFGSAQELVRYERPVVEL